jgi:hypothetical protein
MIKVNIPSNKKNKIFNFYNNLTNISMLDYIFNKIINIKNNIYSINLLHEFHIQIIQLYKNCTMYNEENITILCDICMEFNMKLVKTGCTNNHTICKICLDKIKNSNCPFCREKLNIHKETIFIPIIYSSTHEERERERGRELDRQIDRELKIEREDNLYMIEYYNDDYIDRHLEQCVF